MERLDLLAKKRGVPLLLDNAYGTPFPSIIHVPATPVRPRRCCCPHLGGEGAPLALHHLPVCRALPRGGGCREGVAGGPLRPKNEEWPCAGGGPRQPISFRAGFTLYMVTIIENYSVKPACCRWADLRARVVERPDDVGGEPLHRAVQQHLRAFSVIIRTFYRETQ